MSLLVKIGKKGKKLLKNFIAPSQPIEVRYTRRIERICTDRRICAMTFDDGPMDLPASPDRFGGKSLTDILLDTLEEFGAKGTFDVIGSTKENYPDRPGKLGTAAWGGVRYDHYPNFGEDAHGGAEANARLIRRMLDAGHQVTNHGGKHILFGKKPFVYGARAYLGSFDAVVDDLKSLHERMQTEYGYALKLARPPHYVDAIGDGFTSYDAYEAMDYQYMAASFDGAGWLPSSLQDPDAALEAEVRAMVEPMKKLLEKDPDALCGQIIFQKDGYNMAVRTPVAFGLRKQLELLKQYGYSVVTVSELMAESPFADLGRNDPLFEKLCDLADRRAVAYRDNTLQLDRRMTYGELALLLCPKAEALSRRNAQIRALRRAVPFSWGAVDWCIEHRLLLPEHRADLPVASLPEAYFEKTADFSRRSIFAALKELPE